jgi:hypothetical protein
MPCCGPTDDADKRSEGLQRHLLGEVLEDEVHDHRPCHEQQHGERHQRVGGSGVCGPSSSAFDSRPSHSTSDSNSPTRSALLSNRSHYTFVSSFIDARAAWNEGGGGVEAAGGLRRTAGEGGQIGKNCFD